MTLQKPRPAEWPGKSLVFGTIAVLLSVFSCLALLEIGLRFFPVTSGLRTQPVTPENPIFRFEPNRTMIFSKGWDFKMLNVRHSNNAGWVNNQDYRNEDARPLLAVIGDLYVEALMVPYPETMYGRLAEALRGKLKVYSFGASGAPLSQYLIWAQHAVREYGAKAVIINVVGNDFDESYFTYLKGPGWWVYVPDADGRLRLELAEYRPGWIRRNVSNSAVARYVFFNLQFTNIWRDLKSKFGSPLIAGPRFAGNTAAEADTARMEISLAVIDAWFRDLPDIVGLPPDRILFTLDGFRYPQEVPKGDTYFGKMRQAFIAKAQSLQYVVIDLDQWFFADYEKRRERFEYPMDGHWNGIGHEVAARAVLTSDLLRSLNEKETIGDRHAPTR